MKVSIVMPIYNTPMEYLNLSIKSILEQSFKDFEFIICDDGSSNGCYEYIKDTFLDDRILLIKNNENKGITFSLNRMIDIARGEYIVRMDADDMCKRERICRQVEFLDANEDCDLVCSSAELFDSKGVWGELVYEEKMLENKDFLFNSPIIHPSICVRRKALIDVGKYLDIKRTGRCEDYDLFMRMQAAGKHLYRTAEKLYLFREDEDAVSRRKFKYRINEFKTRYYGFKLLNLMPQGILYCFKPLILGLLPKCIYIKLQRRGRSKK